MKLRFKLSALGLACIVLLGCFTLPVSAAISEDADNQYRDVTLQVGKQEDVSSAFSYRSDSLLQDWHITGGVTWVSANPAIATVTDKGVITAVKRGYTRVTATYWDNYARQHTCKVFVSVLDPDQSIYQAVTTFSMAAVEGRFIDLRALLHPGYTSDGAYGTINWTSNNSRVASVDENGMVTADSIGTCQITVTYTNANGVTTAQKGNITVGSLQVDDERVVAMSASIKKGSNVDIVRVLYPQYTDYSSLQKELRCTTNDAAVASIDGSIVSAKSAGSCNIRIYRNDNFESEQVITITVY